MKLSASRCIASSQVGTAWTAMAARLSYGSCTSTRRMVSARTILLYGLVM
jgi:hypothetical protein